jgi:hypothetical protein
MSRIYSVSILSAYCSPSWDIFQVVNGSGNGVIIIHECRLGQYEATAAAQNEVLVYRMTATVTGSGGQSVTPVQKEPYDPVSWTPYYQTLNSQPAGAGTSKLWLSDSWNNLQGWLWLPAPEDRLVLSPGNSIVIRATTGYSFAMTGSLIWEEMG